MLIDWQIIVAELATLDSRCEELQVVAQNYQVEERELKEKTAKLFEEYRTIKKRVEELEALLA